MTPKKKPAVKKKVSKKPKKVKVPASKIVTNKGSKGVVMHDVKQ